jgi:citrate lyase subunit beta / citryl-CoA lyase
MDLLQSFLFVPADSARKLASARTHRPDALIYDLEDAVAPDKKNAARELLRNELDSMGPSGAKVFVRVNCAGTQFLRDDLRAAVHPGVYGIMLPKCDDASEIMRLHQGISSLENEVALPEGSIKLGLLLESARGVARAGELARASTRTFALLFGGEDFCADMGIARTRTGEEIAVARSLVALAAKAERLEAIDGPFTDFKDPDGLFQETRRIKQMGFTGKALIHPNQIETVHVAMAPTPEDISLAEEIVTTFEQSGQGVASVRGKMIDEPVVLQAKRILRLGSRFRGAKP